MGKEVKSLNLVMFEVVSQLCNQAKLLARDSASTVLETSGQYLSKEAHSSVKKFHQLYLRTSRELDAQKDAINENVDDLIDQIQARLSTGQEVAEADLQESAAAEQQRVGLSAFQKQLESLIALEDGLREKIGPVLASLQFEDAVSQRLDHIVHGFSLLKTDVPAPDMGDVAKKIAAVLSSTAERAAYYPLVLQEPAPPDDEEGTILFDLTA